MVGSKPGTREYDAAVSCFIGALSHRKSSTSMPGPCGGNLLEAEFQDKVGEYISQVADSWRNIRTANI